MTYHADSHYRRNIRLEGYDYRQSGAYFVTLVGQNRSCLFGDISNDEMILNEAGHMAHHWYAELTNKFPNIRRDAFVCMPNHVHFIVFNHAHPVGADLRVGPADTTSERVNAMGEPVGSPLGVVVQWFKTMTTNAYIRGVKQRGWGSFERRLWQRNYYEHIVRNDESLNRIRQYIAENPACWSKDHENPTRTTLKTKENNSFFI